MVMSKKKITPALRENEKVLSKEDERLNFAEVFGVENHGGWVYAFIFGVIIVAVLGTAIGVVGQVQYYHREYKKLLVLQEEFRQLQIENQSLLLEQQTFSATPQMMNRAMNELGMFYPNVSDRIIIEVNPNVVTHQSVAVAFHPASGVRQ